MEEREIVAKQYLKREEGCGCLLNDEKHYCTDLRNHINSEQCSTAKRMRITSENRGQYQVPHGRLVGWGKGSHCLQDG